ncbi:MAG: response regulator, partial [Thermus sp.]
MRHLNPNLRVLIADDHPLFRLGLRAGLEGEGLVVVAEAQDGEEALEKALAL